MYFEEADECVRGVSSSCANLMFEVRPRRASGLAVCSCENKRGTREFKELVGVAAPSDPVGSILMEILHSVEGGDVEQGCSNLETNLPCLRLLSLSLSISHLCLYLACLRCLSIYMLDISCAKIDICLGMFAHTCIQPQEP